MSKTLGQISYYVAFLDTCVGLFCLLILLLHVYSLVHHITGELHYAGESRLHRLLSRKMWFFVSSICCHFARCCGEVLHTSYALGYLSIQEYSYSPWALNSMLESVWALGVTWWVLMVAIVWIDTAGKQPPYNHVICVILEILHWLRSSAYFPIRTFDMIRRRSTIHLLTLM